MKIARKALHKIELNCAEMIVSRLTQWRDEVGGVNGARCHIDGKQKPPRWHFSPRCRRSMVQMCTRQIGVYTEIGPEKVLKIRCAAILKGSLVTSCNRRHGECSDFSIANHRSTIPRATLCWITIRRKFQPSFHANQTIKPILFL